MSRNPNRPRACTPPHHARRFLAGCITAVMLTVGGGTAHAAPASETPEAGDLSGAVEGAKEAREASPSAASWRTEAQAREAAGDYVGAQAAFAAELEALPTDAVDARRRSRADWERVRETSRGRVADEPVSTHRAELDSEWVAPVPKEQITPHPRPVASAPVDDRGDERIVTKWYFWVTVAAITASAAAVTGIAIKAARDERSDALDASVFSPSMRGPALIRF